MENLLVLMKHENKMISKELEEYLSHLSIFSEETKNEVKAKPEKCACCSPEEFLEIEIESENERSKSSPVNKSLISSFMSFYVRHCSYVPFVYLAFLILTSSIFGEASSFILSLVMSLFSVVIHYHYHFYI